MTFSDEILIKQLTDIAASLLRIEVLLANKATAEVPNVTMHTMKEYPYTYCDERIASEITGLSRAWFQRMRWMGGGPPYVKVGNTKGGSVRYKVDDLTARFENKTIGSTSCTPANRSTTRNAGRKDR